MKYLINYFNTESRWIYADDVWDALETASRFGVIRQAIPITKFDVEEI